MGSLAFGKYRLIAELGHGGMADVFLAVQAGPTGSNFRKLTVIKRLRQNLAEEPEFIAMLVDEARIAARLNHPNVVQTNEVGQADGQYFIAMEYLDGQPLHRIQHRSAQRARSGDGPTLSPEHQYLVLMDALAGLHHAHELADYDGSPLAIVHRDMTPQNIFVTYERQVKVVDFGIAKAAGRAAETRQGIVKGKVRYMAPEQAVNRNVTRRSDIFAVGVMLWEAAVGRRMWRDMDDLEIVRALVGGDLPPMPRDLNPDVPKAIDDICRKALAFRAEDRHASADELRLEIELFLQETGVLLTARRQLGPLVADLFEDKRTELRRIIEEQLSAIKDVPEAPASAPTVVSDSTSDAGLPERPDGTPPLATATALGTTRTLAPTKSQPSARTGRRRRSATAIIGLVAGVVVLAVSLAVWKSTLDPSRGDAHRPETDAAEYVSIRLAATPPHARIRIDDGGLAHTPLQLRVRRDGLVHHAQIAADGYEDHMERISFERDLDATFELRLRTGAPDAGADASSSISLPHASRPPRLPPRPSAPASDHAPEVPSVTPPPRATPSASPSATDRNNLPLDKKDPWGSK